jgi:hypothetical protein
MDSFPAAFACMHPIRTGGLKATRADRRPFACRHAPPALLTARPRGLGECAHGSLVALARSAGTDASTATCTRRRRTPQRACCSLRMMGRGARSRTWSRRKRTSQWANIPVTAPLICQACRDSCCRCTFAGNPPFFARQYLGGTNLIGTLATCSRSDVI